MGQMQKYDFSQTSTDETAEERADANRVTGSLAGLAIALFLVVAGLYVIQLLHKGAVLQDCLMSGQRSCTTVPNTSRS